MLVLVTLLTRHLKERRTDRKASKNTHHQLLKSQESTVGQTASSIFNALPDLKEWQCRYEHAVDVECVPELRPGHLLLYSVYSTKTIVCKYVDLRYHYTARPSNAVLPG